MLFRSVSIVAPGWGCGQPDLSVLCTRGGILNPNQQYPAIYVHFTAMTVGHYKSCVQATLLPNGPYPRNDPNPSNNTACGEGDVTLPPPPCLKTATGSPLMITGTGTAPLPLDADQMAMNNWSQNAPLDSNLWLKAANKTSSCAASGANTICTRKAQPCR